MVDTRDHGYAWVALAAMFFLNVIFSASYSTLGIFLVEFLTYFRTTKTSITWIGALNMLVGNIASIFGGAIMKRIGGRVFLTGSALLLCLSCVLSGLFPNLPILYTFFGVFSGIGYLFLHTGGLVSVQHWFEKRRSLASGIFMTGQCIGIFIWPPITRWLIDLYCWQGALIVLGAIFLNGAVCAALLRKPPKATSTTTTINSTTSKKDDKKSCQKLWARIREFFPFFLFLVASILLQMGHMAMYVYTPVRAKDLHIDHHRSPLLISVIGLTGIFSRPMSGWLGDRKCINRTIMYGMAVIITGSFLLLSTQFKNFPLLMVASIAFGIFSAGYTAIIGAFLVDIAGLANIEIASGLFLASMGIGNMCLNVAAGTVLDLIGDSIILFWVFGAMQVAAGILILTIPFAKRACVQRTQNVTVIESMIIEDK